MFSLILAFDFFLALMDKICLTQKHQHPRQGGEGSIREEAPEIEVEQKNDGSFVTHSHLRLQVTFRTDNCTAMKLASWQPTLT